MTASSSTFAIIIACAIIAITILLYSGYALYRSRKEQRQAVEQVSRRREALRERHRHEQQRWREQRLRDVIMLLVDRGEVVEGIPLAVHIRGRHEVSCRRELRRHRRSRSNDALRQIENEFREEEEAAVPAEVRAITHATLEELLANGRPTEAAPGPDLLQMLLEGHTPEEILSNGSDMSSTRSDTSSDVDGHEANNAGGSNEAVHSTSPMSGGLAFDPVQPHGVSESPHTHTAPPVAVTSTAPLAPADPHAQWQERQRAAIIHTLHAERAGRKRQGRLAEEVYGPGYEYIRNPNNSNVDLCDQASFGGSRATENTSALRILMAPLTPMLNRVKHRRSTFDNTSRSDQHTSQDQAQESSQQQLHMVGSTTDYNLGVLTWSNPCAISIRCPY